MASDLEPKWLRIGRPYFSPEKKRMRSRRWSRLQRAPVSDLCGGGVGHFCCVFHTESRCRGPNKVQKGLETNWAIFLYNINRPNDQNCLLNVGFVVFVVQKLPRRRRQILVILRALSKNCGFYRSGCGKDMETNWETTCLHRFFTGKTQEN